MAQTAAERDALRGDIERTHATNRTQIENQYVQDRNDLEEEYHKDIKESEDARRAALVAAGLNPNGSDPQGRND